MAFKFLFWKTVGFKGQYLNCQKSWTMESYLKKNVRKTYCMIMGLKIEIFLSFWLY